MNINEGIVGYRIIGQNFILLMTKRITLLKELIQLDRIYKVI